MGRGAPLRACVSGISFLAAKPSRYRVVIFCIYFRVNSSTGFGTGRSRLKVSWYDEFAERTVSFVFFQHICISAKQIDENNHSEQRRISSALELGLASFYFLSNMFRGRG